jgi:hypothetical protein
VWVIRGWTVVPISLEVHRCTVFKREARLWVAEYHNFWSDAIVHCHISSGGQNRKPLELTCCLPAIDHYCLFQIHVDTALLPTSTVSSCSAIVVNLMSLLVTHERKCYGTSYVNILYQSLKICNNGREMATTKQQSDNNIALTSTYRTTRSIVECSMWVRVQTYSLVVQVLLLCRPHVCEAS